MIRLKQIYRCEVCGNIVEVVHGGMGKLVCCGREMTLINEKDSDVGLEKHVPVFEKTQDKVTIKVGNIEHPMEEDHHIEWIELQTPKCVYKKYLKAGEKPEAVFNTSEDVVCIREYCSVHGLWKNR